MMNNRRKLLFRESSKYIILFASLLLVTYTAINGCKKVLEQPTGSHQTLVWGNLSNSNYSISICRDGHNTDLSKIIIPGDVIMLRQSDNAHLMNEPCRIRQPLRAGGQIILFLLVLQCGVHNKCNEPRVAFVIFI